MSVIAQETGLGDMAKPSLIIYFTTPCEKKQFFWG
jgi:hypothetical protein